MKKLYIDCSMGVAGDMLMASLYELLDNKEEYISKVNEIGIPGVVVSSEIKESCGVTGSHMHVLVNGEEEGHEHHHHHEHEHEHHHHHDHEHEHHHHHEHEHHNDHEHHHDHEHGHHHHSGMADIINLIDSFNVSDKVKENAKAVYKLIAESECKVHGKDMENIHFHEVGTLDAVADVVGNCILMEMLGYPEVYASPIHVGSGTVKCAHGVLPVPAPATALILTGIPIYSSEIKGELCTPTGAALLKHFTNKFGQMPAMTIEKIGYGMGTKEFERANCVRALLSGDEELALHNDEICELSANIDDMTAEELSFALETLLDEGALDTFVEPIVMKKSRPANKLVCLCRVEDSAKFATLILKHTSTIGVRETLHKRYTLDRSFVEKETPYGNVTFKVSEGYGVKKEKPEFDELVKIAKKNNLSLKEVKEKIK